jgi:hypothetical protein
MYFLKEDFFTDVLSCFFSLQLMERQLSKEEQGITTATIVHLCLILIFA